MFDEVLDVTQDVVQPEATLNLDAGTEPQAQSQEDLGEHEGADTGNLVEGEIVHHAQTAEENKLFADTRRKQELESVRAQLEVERAAREQAERKAGQAKEVLGMYFEGGDISSLIDHAKAQATGRSPQEVAREREQSEAVASQLAEHNRQLESYRMREVERVMREDLSKIQRINPNVKTLDALGEPYYRLISAGVDAITAYNAVIAGRPKPKLPDASDKDHLIPSGGVASKGDAVEIPSSDMEYYQDAFPKDTPAQLKERYNRIIARQKGK